MEGGPESGSNQPRALDGSDFATELVDILTGPESPPVPAPEDTPNADSFEVAFWEGAADWSRRFGSGPATIPRFPAPLDVEALRFKTKANTAFKEALKLLEEL